MLVLSLFAPTLSAILAVVPFAKTTAAIASGEQQFSFFSVTTNVEDEDGVAVSNAWVKAYSPDWGISFPHNEEWGRTDSTGSYRFRLPIGDWLFLCSSGYEYINRNPNKGFFDKNSVYVASNLSLVLKPDASVDLNVTDEKGDPLRIDEIYAFDEENVPAIPPAIVGRADSGAFTLQISSDLNVTCLFYSRSTPSNNGYILSKGNITANRLSTIGAENASRITFNGYDSDHSPSSSWDIEFRLPQMYLGNWVFSQRVYGTTSNYVTPTNVLMNPRYIHQGWYYYFESIACKLSYDAEYHYSLGRDATFNLWIIKHDTQFWFDMRDQFGNVVAFFSGPDSTRHLEMRIYEESLLVFDDDIGEHIPGSMFYGLGKTYLDSSTFQLNATLGPLGNLGNITIQGPLHDDRYQAENTTLKTTHFELDAPSEYFWTLNGESRLNIFGEYLETLYGSIGNYVGETLEMSPHSGEINFEWCGVAGTSFIGFGVGVARWPVHIQPGCLGVLAHEVGHLYSFTPPFLYSVECPLFGEPLATYLGIEGISSLHGDNVRRWYWGSHTGFLDHLMGDSTAGDIERMQFLFFYIHKTYGPEAHKEFFKIYDSDLGKQLKDRGFSNMETAVVLYSYIVHENLAWLFRLAGLNISDSRVDAGLIIVPEFPPQLMVPILIITTMLAAFAFRRKRSQGTQFSSPDAEHSVSLSHAKVSIVSLPSFSFLSVFLKKS